MNSAYIHLTLAIVLEVIATSALKATNSFTRFWPSVAVVVGYCAAFYFVALTLRVIPIGITYAIWSGVGIILITIVAAIVYKQIPDIPAISGIVLIILGVVVINMFSKCVVH